MAALSQEDIEFLQNVDAEIETSSDDESNLMLHGLVSLVRTLANRLDDSDQRVRNLSRRLDEIRELRKRMNLLLGG